MADIFNIIGETWKEVPDIRKIANTKSGVSRIQFSFIVGAIPKQLSELLLWKDNAYSIIEIDVNGLSGIAVQIRKGK